MDKVCPACNALTNLDKNCPVCGHQMVDGGSIENYYGPYSPYMDHGLLQESDNYCTHLCYCPICHYDVRITLEMVKI